MLNKILNFITPGPLDEIVGFGARVFSSWISLGLVLGLVITIIALFSGTPVDFPTFLLVIGSMPITICLLGFIGIVINSILGRRSEYPGWYWLIFPISTYLLIGLWLGLAYFGFILGMIGITLPKSSPIDPWQPRGIDPKKFREQTSNSSLEDFLKEFKKELEQLQKLEKSEKLDPNQKKLIQKIRRFDRSKYEHRLRDLLAEDELEDLILLLLMLLGAEVK